MSGGDPDRTLLEVGVVRKPHGLRGQVVVELITNRTERLAPGSVLSGPDGPLEVVATGPAPGTDRWLVTFRDVSSREAADGLRGAVLRAEAIVDPDALWVHDLIGSEVSEPTGRVIGRVADVEANPASDLLVLADGTLIPLRFVTDHAPGRIVVDLPAGLLDL